jgi:hypothetical protein
MVATWVTNWVVVGAPNVPVVFDAGVCRVEWQPHSTAPSTMMVVSRAALTELASEPAASRGRVSVDAFSVWWNATAFLSLIKSRIKQSSPRSGVALLIAELVSARPE